MRSLGRIGETVGGTHTDQATEGWNVKREGRIPPVSSQTAPWSPGSLSDPSVSAPKP